MPGTAKRMIKKLHATIHRRYRRGGFMEQQKAIALAWICLFSIVALSAILVHDLFSGSASRTYYLFAIVPVIATLCVEVVQVVMGRFRRGIDGMFVLLVGIHLASGAGVVLSGRMYSFYAGFGLYAPALVLCSAVFARRRTFMLVSFAEMASLAFFRHIPSPGCPPELARVFGRDRWDSLNSTALVWGVAWGFVSIVDRALARVQRELDRNIELRDSLETKVRERTLDLDKAREAAEAANRAKGAFLANMSHEIRTPLHGIVGLTDQVLREGPPPSQEERLRLIADSGAHLLAVIQDILDCSKIEAGGVELHPEAIELRRFAHGVAASLEPLAQAKSIGFSVEFAPDLPGWVRVDPIRLRQVLTNILGNAIKFTVSGEVSLSVARTDGWLRFEVRDTGIGMSPQAAEHVFERFRQADDTISRRFGGSGLGLTISRLLVEAMGGRLELESSEGAGSEFVVHLPCEEGEEPVDVRVDDSSAAADPVDGVAGMRVLVVDDNEINRRVVESVLAFEGCDCVLTDDARSALERLSEERFDVVLMDCQMPDMDGLEATRLLRAWSGSSDLRMRRAAGIPVLALTADADPETGRACLEAGMDDLLVKPFRSAQLREILLRWKDRSVG
jgi:signal transduction histidine kinase/ActR/RegA family two-component response regulator